MNKITRLSAFTILLMLLAFNAAAQSTEWVNQIIVVNNGRTETTPPYIDYVTVMSFNPTTHTTMVFDTIYTQSATDILIKDNKCWVAATDSIIQYNIDTYQRINAIADSGTSRMYLFDYGSNHFLVVSKKAPVSRFFVEVLQQSDLSLAGLVDNISDQCAGITSEYDTVYVAVNGGPQGQEGRMAVIKGSDFTKVREVDFGGLGQGITDLLPFGANIFTVNWTPSGGTSGAICAYNYYNASFNMHYYNRTIGKAFGIQNTTMYLKVDGGVGTFDLVGQNLNTNLIIPDPSVQYRMSILGGAVDYVNSKLYTNLGTQISNGLGYVTNLSGDSLTSFTEGINAFNLAIDFRTPSGIGNVSKASSLIVVAPNPVGSSFEVKYLGQGTVSGITISDLSGRMLYQKELSSGVRSWVISDAGLSSGLYMLTLKTSEGNLTTKIAKQ
jgi:hypothetical protein